MYHFDLVEFLFFLPREHRKTLLLYS
jgi:hypothetical protein